MQYWPHKRSERLSARIRSWVSVPGKLGGFPAYKAGMTHVQVHDTNPNNVTKGMTVSFPVTILECPPVKVIGIRLYRHSYVGEQVIRDILATNLDKYQGRRLDLPKTAHTHDGVALDGVTRVMALLSTQPHMTGIKKTPEVLEMALGGKDAKEQFALAKDLLGKEVSVEQVFAAGQQLDTHTITKGKGFQGSIKIFGIHLKAHKSEKGRRAPGSVGPWHAPKNYRSPHPGKHGFHQRTEHNKLCMMIGTKPDEINQKGGITHYGLVKNHFILIKGCVGGAKKRLITLTHAQRPNHRTPKKAPQITFISTGSKQ